MKFEKPEMELVMFASEDIITTSGDEKLADNKVIQAAEEATEYVNLFGFDGNGQYNQ